MSWPGAAPLLADKSAWARVAVYAEDWLAALDDRRIVTCAIVQLELLYSARTQTDVQRLDQDLAILRDLPISRGTLVAAKRAMIELASKGSDGHHRVPPPDAIIAACAAEHGCAVLHYDARYDRLATVLEFDSIWAVARGSVP